MPPKRSATDTVASSKRFRTAIDESAEELLCPITQSLPLDPVMAEDGKVYERAAIEDWLKQHQRSPITNLPMGTKLVAATQIKNIIERMVISDALPEDKASAWKERIRQQEEVVEKRRAVEAGDLEAAHTLGNWYDHGKNGLAVDQKRAFEFFKVAAEGGHKKGAGRLSTFYYYGRGVEVNKALALRWAGAAATLGNGNGKQILSIFYDKGELGMPIDKEYAFKLKVAASEADSLNSRGLYDLAIRCEQGVGTAIDMEKAEALMRKAVDQNKPLDHVHRARDWLSARGLAQQ
jgi:TPR repeat protein